MLNTNKNSISALDPTKIHLPEFDYSIFNKSEKIGNDPKKILEKIGLKANDILVDFGSGAGFYTIEAAKIVGNSGKVFAIDINRDILDHLKQKAIDSGLRNIYGIKTDLEKEDSTGLDEGSTDVALMMNLLYLIKNKEILLKGVHKILKPNGKLIVMEWSEKGKLNMLEREQVVKNKEIKDLATKVGFKKVMTFEAGLSHEVNVFMKL
jgi:ubiquinone/menaquinone biosynthesis C-methylase UbiE